MMKFFVFFLFGYLFLGGQAKAALPKRSDYLHIIQKAVEQNLQTSESIIDKWKSNIERSDLFGYSTTSYPANFAELLGFMYQETGEERYAKKAAEMLLVYEELKELFPKEFYADRIEYAKGLPPISDFFSMSSYPKAYRAIQSSSSLNAQDRRTIERGVADCANFLMNYPEWGPMNRAILRAETFFNAALALPYHPDAPAWRRMAQVLSSDSYQRWEEEDAAGYHPVWMLSLMRMVDATDDADFYRSSIPRYYLDYFCHLITPAGLMVDFGDARWPMDWYRFIPIFEKGAAVYHEPIYKWAVERAWNYIQENEVDLTGAYTALAFVDAYRWMDPDLAAEPPAPHSRLVMEDIVGKKVVFRNGTDRKSTFLLLNYRDEGDGAYAGREFLRTSITAEEEKTHHGHSDENSIVSLFHNGSILLHDGGYRDNLPSGAYGQYRSDFYHNRLVTRKNKRWVQIQGDPLSQPIFEFLRNSGAYRPVRTQLLNFLTFEELDFSTTRLLDTELGVQHDRTVLYYKPDSFFIVVDAVEALRDDFFTHTVLWHTQKILARGDNWFDTRIDSINAYKNPGSTNLLIAYLLPEPGRETGTFPIERHWQPETAIYQTLSDHYYAGNREVFVTLLIPHGPKQDPAELVKKFTWLDTGIFPQAVGLAYKTANKTVTFGVKTDPRMDYKPQDYRPRYDYELGKVDYGPFQTDAHVFVANQTGNELYWAASNMVRVKYGERILQESLEMSFALQLDGMPPRPGRAKWRYWEDRLNLSPGAKKR